MLNWLFALAHAPPSHPLCGSSPPIHSICKRQGCDWKECCLFEVDCCLLLLRKECPGCRLQIVVGSGSESSILRSFRWDTFVPLTIVSAPMWRDLTIATTLRIVSSPPLMLSHLESFRVWQSDCCLLLLRKEGRNACCLGAVHGRWNAWIVVSIGLCLSF